MYDDCVHCQHMHTWAHSQYKSAEPSEMLFMSDQKIRTNKLELQVFHKFFFPSASTSSLTSFKLAAEVERAWRKLDGRSGKKSFELKNENLK